MKAYTISFLAGLMMICLNNSCQNANNGLATLPYHIDIEQGIKNVGSVPLSTLGSQIEYVPLETNPGSMLKGISNVFVSDSFIYATDGSRLLLFLRDGKFVKQIGSEGKGPGEYLRVADFIVDKNSHEIYVLASRMVLIFDLDGKFKRDFKIDFPCNQFILKDGDSFMFHPFNLPSPTPDPVYSWYIMDKSGVVKNKLINNLKRVNRGLIIPISALYLFAGTPHFMEFGIDTLYYFDNSIKKPYSVFNLGKIKMKPDPTLEEFPTIKEKVLLYNVKESKTSLFIEVMGDPTIYFVYDKSSSGISALKENGLINDIDGGMVFYPKTILNDNILIDYADAFELIKHLKNSQLSISKIKDKKKADQYVNLVNQLTETSNPVIILLKQ